MSFCEFIKAIKLCIPIDRIYLDELRRFAYGTDASCYRLIPKAVIKVKNESDILSCIHAATKHRVPITFRAAGTSLSGQAITDSVLLLIDNQWSTYKVFENGQKISLDPGVIGSHANFYLLPYKKKIGPDPASINHCKIGGIAANNSSGMCCGVEHNSYHTLASMRIIFANGQILDTSDRASRDCFIKNNSTFITELLKLSKTVKDNQTLSDRIKHKYRIKNTTGYGLNSLVDFDDPIEIIQHLLIGSEGTLAFISNITYNTLPNLKLKTCALVFFKNMHDACDFIEVCKNLPVTAVELMDNISIKTMVGAPGTPDALNYIDQNSAALLIETEADEHDTLNTSIQQVTAALSKIELMPKCPIQFTTTPQQHDILWNLRKGIIPSIGGQREIGTSFVLEDVAVATHKLADMCDDLRLLFKKHDYHNGAIFGHALAGNVHFILTPRFDSEQEVLRFDAFIKDMVTLVAKKYDGSLKAEHSTGRNMAPFVATEWGDELYLTHKKIKELFDEDNILNPGVIINDDPSIHIKNLKQLPQADPIIDLCIECGFCEHVCPSRNVTLTPRQRITVYREISRLSRIKLAPAEAKRLKALKHDYQYLGIDTCAATGLCQTECPVSVNTGELMLKFRKSQNSGLSKLVARVISNNFGMILSLSRFGLTINKLANTLLGANLMRMVYKFVGLFVKIKLQNTAKYLPGAAKKIGKKGKIE